jgi:hypothetical protein
MFTDNPSEHVDEVAETINSGVRFGIHPGGQLEGSSSRNGVVERKGETSSDNSVQITEHSSRQDLLSII